MGVRKMSEKINIPLAGGLLAGIVASLCCVGPLFLLFLGFGGAWVSNLTALEPYRPLFIGIALIALVMAYIRIYRPKPEQSCKDAEDCAKLQANHLHKSLFICVLFLVLASITSPYLIPLIYE